MTRRQNKKINASRNTKDRHVRKVYIESLMPKEIEEGEIFTKIKSIISDCICKTVVFVGVNIPEKPLNFLANEYTDKILSILASLGRKKRENE